MTFTEFAYLEAAIVAALVLTGLIVAGLRASLRRWTVGWANEAHRLGLRVELIRARPRQVPPIRLIGDHNGQPVEITAGRDVAPGGGGAARQVRYYTEVRVGRRGKSQRHDGKHRGRKLERLLNRLAPPPASPPQP